MFSEKLVIARVTLEVSEGMWNSAVFKPQKSDKMFKDEQDRFCIGHLTLVSRTAQTQWPKPGDYKPHAPGHKGFSSAPQNLTEARTALHRGHHASVPRLPLREARHLSATFPIRERHPRRRKAGQLRRHPAGAPARLDDGTHVTMRSRWLPQAASRSPRGDRGQDFIGAIFSIYGARGCGAPRRTRVDHPRLDGSRDARRRRSVELGASLTIRRSEPSRPQNYQGATRWTAPSWRRGPSSHSEPA